MEEAKKEALMNCSSLDELLNIEFGEVGTPSREVFDKETEAFCLVFEKYLKTESIGINMK